MSTLRRPTLRPRWLLERRGPLLWLTFGLGWAADTLTAIQFFLVPGTTELNPVTVLFYAVVGPPGVVLAAACYAAIVVAIVRRLPTPLDSKVLFGVTVIYVAIAIHNISLLVWGVSLLGIYTLLALTAILSVAVSFLTAGYERGFLNYLVGSPSGNPIAMYCYGAVLFALAAAVVQTAGQPFVLVVSRSLFMTYLPPSSAEQVFAQFVIGALFVFTTWHLRPSRRRTRIAHGQ